MNMSGLKQVMANWNAASSVIDQIKDRFDSGTNTPCNSINYIWQISRVLSAMPMYLHQASTFEGRYELIPSVVAAAYKMAGGPFLTAIKLLGRQITFQKPTSFFSRVEAAEFNQITERLGTFNLRNATCAGSPQIVERFLAMIMTDEKRGAYVGEDPLREIFAGQEFLNYAILSMVLDYYKIFKCAEIAVLHTDFLLSLTDVVKSRTDDRLTDHLVQNDGWIYGLGTTIFSFSIFKNPSKDKLLAHKKYLASVREDIIAEITHLLKRLKNFETIHLFRRQPTEPPTSPDLYLIALTQFLSDYQAGAVALQRQIDEALGWSPRPIDWRDFMEGCELSFLSAAIDTLSGTSAMR